MFTTHLVETQPPAGQEPLSFDHVTNVRETAAGRVVFRDSSVTPNFPTENCKKASKHKQSNLSTPTKKPRKKHGKETVVINSPTVKAGFENSSNTNGSLPQSDLEVAKLVHQRMNYVETYAEGHDENAV